jgi:hypothetical protein
MRSQNIATPYPSPPDTRCDASSRLQGRWLPSRAELQSPFAAQQAIAKCAANSLESQEVRFPKPDPWFEFYALPRWTASGRTTQYTAWRFIKSSKFCSWDIGVRQIVLILTDPSAADSNQSVPVETRRNEDDHYPRRSRDILCPRKRL